MEVEQGDAVPAFLLRRFFSFLAAKTTCMFVNSPSYTLQ